MVKIRFTKLVISTQFGNLAPGAILTCGEAHANHFVTELGAAEYLQPKPSEPPPEMAAVSEPDETEAEPVEAPTKKTRRR